MKHKNLHVNFQDHFLYFSRVYFPVAVSQLKHNLPKDAGGGARVDQCGLPASDKDKKIDTKH